MFDRLGRDALLPAIFGAAGFGLWHAAVAWLGVPAFLLPAPLDVAAELIGRFPHYLRHFGITLGTALAGFGIAVAASVATAALFTYSRTLARGFYPYVLTLKITPTTAIAPLLVLWFGIGLTPKIAIAALICFFPVFVGALKGFRTVDADAQNVFRSLGATRWQTFRYLRFPSALPFLFPALKVSAMLSLAGAFVGEFVAANQGAGYLVLTAMRLYKSVDLFAVVAITVLGGFALFALVSFLERKAVFWQRSENL